MTIKLMGSITPNDWSQILALLNDTDIETLKTNNIQWWHSHCNWSMPDVTNNPSDTDYVAIGRVNFNKYFVVHAGCDTSGFGCMGDYARVSYHETFEDAVSMGLTRESRKWLGVSLPGE